jgi:CHRD domain
VNATVARAPGNGKFLPSRSSSKSIGSAPDRQFGEESMPNHKLLFPMLLMTVLMVGVAHAATKVFKATMDGSSEAPPTASTGTGTGTATLDTVSRKLTWDVTYSGLTGPAMAAHIHGPADPGKNAGVVVPLAGSSKSPITGSKVLTPAEVSDLEAGKYYVNIHTAANKGGEIRGQLLPAQ